MSLGTLAINNNSDQVVGTGTSFTTELKVNDFIAVPSGGVTYTMVVKAIASDTALTITRPFSGPNVTGANWAAIPAGTMVGVTAKIADDTAYTMRMYVNEANNWMSLLTIDGEVTVYAPDGSSYTGPSWLKLSRIMGTLGMPALTTIAAQIHADSNGFYRTSSPPIIKIWGDGTSELNDESEGATVVRVDTGVYKVSGVLGFNSSPEWGGADGGYSVPQNGNGLPLLWLDFEIAPDGDITIRTYHRTHSDAPEFARNLIGIRNGDGSFTETVRDGEPVDIPAGRWIDLRVEMPHNSLWNIKQIEAQEAREKAERERQENQQDAQV